MLLNIYNRKIDCFRPMWINCGGTQVHCLSCRRSRGTLLGKDTDHCGEYARRWFDGSCDQGGLPFSLHRARFVMNQVLTLLIGSPVFCARHSTSASVGCGANEKWYSRMAFAGRGILFRSDRWFETACSIRATGKVAERPLFFKGVIVAVVGWGKARPLPCPVETDALRLKADGFGRRRRPRLMQCDRRI